MKKIKGKDVTMFRQVPSGAWICETLHPSGDYVVSRVYMGGYKKKMAKLLFIQFMEEHGHKNLLCHENLL